MNRISLLTRAVALTVLLGNTLTATAQNCGNLVANGKFETQLAVPTRVGNMGGGGQGGAGATNVPDQLSDWFSPTGGSPDFYATNASANSPVQPNNENTVVGSFTPYSPIGAIGLLARQKSPYTDDYIDRVSEYATSRLPNGILPAGQYYAQFKVSLSKTPQAARSTIKQGFGLMFTSASPQGQQVGAQNRDFLSIPTTASTVLSGSIGEEAINYGLQGAANWKTISGQFSATSGQALQ